MEDKSIMIKTREGKRIIHIDEYTDKEIWISIQLAGGGASTSMTVEQAKQMIAGLTSLVEAMEVAV
jgi:S-methylmethionine-dependent homocysteine/selenocysteine methylase